MGLFDKIKAVLSDVTQSEAGKVAPVPEVKKRTQVKTPKSVKDPSTIKEPKAKKTRTNKKPEAINPAKVAANKAKEPYVAVLGMELDPSNPGQGAFELDWNDIFVAKLVRAGYQGKTDQDIVDNWFQSVCRNVVLETYQQEQADPEIRAAGSNRRDLGNGRTEVS